MYRISLTQKTALSLEEAWNFFGNPKNLTILTPPDMGFEMLDDLPESVYEGMLIRYKVSPLLGINMNWTSEISKMAEKKYFIDIQVEGPYKYWHHEHHFHETKEGVVIHDLIHYKLPLGPLGRILHRPLVKKKLDSIFAFRLKKVEEFFGQRNFE